MIYMYMHGELKFIVELDQINTSYYYTHVFLFCLNLFLIIIQSYLFQTEIRESILRSRIGRLCLL